MPRVRAGLVFIRILQDGAMPARIAAKPLAARARLAKSLMNSTQPSAKLAAERHVGIAGAVGLVETYVMQYHKFV